MIVFLRPSGPTWTVLISYASAGERGALGLTKSPNEGPAFSVSLKDVEGRVRFAEASGAGGCGVSEVVAKALSGVRERGTDFIVEADEARRQRDRDMGTAIAEGSWYGGEKEEAEKEESEMGGQKAATNALNTRAACGSGFRAPRMQHAHACRRSALRPVQRILNNVANSPDPRPRQHPTPIAASPPAPASICALELLGGACTRIRDARRKRPR